jgi:hypothetical protein
LLLCAHAGFREVREVAIARSPSRGRHREVAIALPFSSEHEDYVQLLTDIATHLARARLGPSRRLVSAPAL